MADSSDSDEFHSPGGQEAVVGGQQAPSATDAAEGAAAGSQLQEAMQTLACSLTLHVLQEALGPTATAALGGKSAADFLTAGRAAATPNRKGRMPRQKRPRTQRRFSAYNLFVMAASQHTGVGNLGVLIDAWRGLKPETKASVVARLDAIKERCNSVAGEGKVDVARELAAWEAAQGLPALDWKGLVGPHAGAAGTSAPPHQGGPKRKQHTVAAAAERLSAKRPLSKVKQETVVGTM